MVISTNDDKDWQEYEERYEYENAKDLPKSLRTTRDKRIIREYEKKNNIGFQMNVQWKLIITILGTIASLITIYTFIVS